jgi:tRNA A37 methylthiotransferase MiaB
MLPSVLRYFQAVDKHSSLFQILIWLENADQAQVGQFYDVKITKAMEYDLVGEIV